MSKLVDMNFDEVSFVKKGANQYSKVSIAKSLESEEKNMSGELFNEDGSVVDPEDLNEGDVVFDQEGNEFKVTAEADDNDDNDDDDENEDVEKSIRSGANALRRSFQRGSTVGDMRGQTFTSPAAQGIYDRANRHAGGLHGAAHFTGRNKRKIAGGAAGTAAGGTGYGVYQSRDKESLGKSLREEFSKALTDEDRDQIITKAFDQMEEFQLQAEYAAEIAKSEQDARVFNEYVGIAKSYTLPFDDDELAYAMMEAESNLTPESAEIVAKAFDLASNAIETEIGYEGFDGPSVMNEVGDFMEEIGKSNDPDAFLQLMESNPELYDEYLNEQQS